MPVPSDEATSPASDDPSDAARFDRVSEGLKRGFQALATADIRSEDKPRWQQRLIAITNSSKHDLATAEARLDRFFTDLDGAAEGRD